MKVLSQALRRGLGRVVCAVALARAGAGEPASAPPLPPVPPGHPDLTNRVTVAVPTIPKVTPGRPRTVPPPPPSVAPLRPGTASAMTPVVRSGNAAFPRGAATVNQPETVLAWDGLVKELTLKPGETRGRFHFSFTNTSPDDVTIAYVRTSCGCTVPKVPTLPWTIPPSAQATFDVELDARGKSGVVTKTITIESSAGYRYLTVRAVVPASGAGAMSQVERARNLQAALANRQAVLKGDCAVCHVTPGVGKTGEDLYIAVCGVCHEAEHRASMVPDLQALSRPLPAGDWRRIIRSGKKDSLMPAFAIAEDGVLTDAQVDSLVEYLTGPFRAQPPHAPRTLPAGPNPVPLPVD